MDQFAIMRACMSGDKEKWVSSKVNLPEVAQGRPRTDWTVTEIQDIRNRGEAIKAGETTVDVATAIFKLTLERHKALGKIKPSTVNSGESF